MRESLSDLDDLLLSHAKKVLKQALELRSSLTSPLSYSIIYKKRWEHEAKEIVSGFLGERVTLLGKDSGLVAEGGEWVCISDPLDGSKNFFTDMKFYAYSLALAHGGELVYALVVDLENMNIYRAERGRGAFLNGERLSDIASRRVYMYDVICTNVELRGLSTIDPHCASLALCMLAQGAASLAIGDTWNIDIAAGYLIARETGNEFLTWGLKAYTPSVSDREPARYIAGTPKSLKEFLEEHKSSLPLKIRRSLVSGYSLSDNE